MNVVRTFQIRAVMECVMALAGTLIPARAAEPPRVFYVNSYHEGYPSSDATMAAIREVLGRQGVVLQVAFLDAKRHPAEADVRRRAAEVLAAMRGFRPDLVIASDDDAVKYIVAPHYRSGPVPAVFCGVNWSARQYGLPTPNVTGMVEVVPIEDTLRELRRVRPGVRRLRVLTEDSLSERSSRELVGPRYQRLGFEADFVFVGDFEAWKSAFVAAQSQADVVYLPTNGAIRGWDARVAIEWVRSHIRKPVVSCDDFMMPDAVFGLTKAPREQGEWAARTALEILHGKKPGEIPVTENRQTRCLVNLVLAARIGFQAPAGLDCSAVQ